jgi:hypothetical protein
MKLSDIFLGDKQIANTQKSEQTDYAQTAALNRQIKSMVPGQTIQGEIVEKNGTDVRIKISEDLTMNARLEQNMNLEVGKNMTFEVRNNGRILSLSPLFANMATDANALKALDMAQLPVNNTTVEMTDLMMKAGLAVDKNSLQQVYREINSYPQSDISDIIDLHRLSLAVNDENVAQVASYKNFNYQILNGMTDIMNEINDLVNSMTASGDTENAAKLYSDIISMAVNQVFDTDIAINSEETAQGMEENMQLNTQPENANAVADTAIKEVFADVQENVENTAAANKALAILEQIAGKTSPENDVLQEKGAEVKTFDENAELIAKLTGQSVNQNTDPNVLLELYGKALENALNSHDTKSLNDLLGNADLKNLLNENLQKSWTLKPEDVGNLGKVEEIYHRLDRQLKSLTQTLENAGTESGSAYKAVTNMSQNIDFMHQLNQMYAYVQLPLRLNQGNAHGELYVYTNRKNMAAKDGKISALLHLDMEHLGPVDVYVAMENSNVSTKFYVQDDSMLDFLSEHMDILTSRLEKRGYNLNFAMQVRDDDIEEGGVKTILKQQEGQTALAEYAFDVRA